jgi:hypothetical protein
VSKDTALAISELIDSRDRSAECRRNHIRKAGRQENGHRAFPAFLASSFVTFWRSAKSATEPQGCSPAEFGRVVIEYPNRNSTMLFSRTDDVIVIF